MRRIIDITVQKKTVVILINPALRTVMKMLHGCTLPKKPILRYIKDPSPKAIYIFEAFVASHRQVADVLGISIDGSNTGFIELHSSNRLFIGNKMGDVYTMNYLLREEEG